MDNSSEYANASALATAATLHSLINSVRGWLDSFLDVVVLEAKKGRHRTRVDVRIWRRRNRFIDDR